jgi:hypothetical protein
MVLAYQKFPHHSLRNHRLGTVGNSTGISRAIADLPTDNLARNIRSTGWCVAVIFCVCRVWGNTGIYSDIIFLELQHKSGPDCLFFIIIIIIICIPDKVIPWGVT